MPEYLAPGVYVEEVSFRSKSIEGVSTSTAGFIGPTRFGPTTGTQLVTSFGEFERLYGSIEPLEFDGEAVPAVNYVAHAVRAFFDNGGTRVYLARVFEAKSETDDGRAAAKLKGDGDGDPAKVRRLRARYPGVAANGLRLVVTANASQNVLGFDPSDPEADLTKKRRRATGLAANDIVMIAGLPTKTATTTPGFYVVSRVIDAANPSGILQFTSVVDGAKKPLLSALDPTLDQVRLVTISVLVDRPNSPDDTFLSDLSPHPDGRNALLRYIELDATPSRAAVMPVYLDTGADKPTLGSILGELFKTGDTDSGIDAAKLIDDAAPTSARQVTYVLIGGNDGRRPGLTTYAGTTDSKLVKTGFVALEDIEDISIVAAPAISATATASVRQSLQAALISHAERMRYRIAVLDSPPDQDLNGVRAVRGQIDSKYAAFYYPWVTVTDPLTSQPINLPPSGFVAGIYARNDVERGVYKAPANEVVRGAIGFEKTLNKPQQDVLNPEGINCFRFFEGRGLRLWGARTATSDPEWKYVNLRRYFAYLERSIDKGTQWAVFEPNGEALWANVRRTVEDFLFNEWRGGALLGDKPEKAFFVRCDRSTMTQNDLDNGRLVCLVGVAPLRPAEFVIFRIGQFTADAQR